MAVRLAGLWSPSGDHSVADGTRDQMLARFPAEAHWVRSLRISPVGVAVIDTSGDSQPRDAGAESADGEIGVAGTIRLDGRRSLEEALGDARVPPLGDAGLIVETYRRWGVAAFSRISGDFAFVLWDRARESLFLVRDPFGARRLHYTSWDGQVAFSTEVEGVLAWPRTSRELDDVTILDNLLARYQTRTRTFFRSIRRVQPGHFVRFRSGRADEIRYAVPPVDSTRFASLNEYAEAFRDALNVSLSERLPPSGRVVCHLSGGLDSSSIAYLAAAALGRQGRQDDLVLATARFHGLSCDEGAIAGRTAARLGRSLQEWDGAKPELTDLEKPRLAWPFGRSSICASWQGDLDLAGRAGASTLLSGQGGNQITEELDYLPDAWREDGPRGCLGALWASSKGRPWRWRRHYFVQMLREARSAFVPPYVEADRMRRHDPLFQSPPSWLGPRLGSAWFELQQETVLPSAREPITGSWMGDWIWQAATGDARNCWTLEHEDARSAERGMEFRYPFLSWSLMGLVMSVPWRMKAPRSYGRVLHREAMRGILPEDLRLRTAFLFFSQAITQNYQRALPLMKSILGRPSLLAADLVRPADINRLLRSWSERMNEQPLSATAADAWRLLRDFAALEAWLGSFSC